jgi:hypothetical protein
MFSLLDSPPQLTAGQALSLQLNSSVTNFASLAASSTGWRISLVRPDDNTADLGLMADWEVWNDVIWKWHMNVSSSHLLQVGEDGRHLLAHTLGTDKFAWSGCLAASVAGAVCGYKGGGVALSLYINAGCVCAAVTG